MSINWDECQARILECLLAQKSKEAIALAREALAQGATPAVFFEKCVTPALVEIGNRFETLELFLPEMVVAAEIVQNINNQVITPALEADSTTAQTARLGKILLATVQGDLHDIGKSMVALMLRVNGFEVVDLGIDVPPSIIVEQAEKENVDIIGLSALLTTCLPYMKDTVDFLVETGMRDKYAIIVGGAAPTAAFARQLGVDAYGESAAEAVKICRDLIQEPA